MCRRVSDQASNENAEVTSFCQGLSRVHVNYVKIEKYIKFINFKFLRKYKLLFHIEPIQFDKI